MMEKKAEIEQQEKISELLKQMQEKDIDMKELMQILEKYRPDAEYDFAQRVYDTLTDSLNNDYALSQVEKRTKWAVAVPSCTMKQSECAGIFPDV